METQNQNQGQEAPAKTSKQHRFLPFLLLLLGLLVGTAAGAVVVGAATARASAPRAEKPGLAAGEEDPDADDEDGHAAGGAKGGNTASVPYEVEDLVLNPAGSQGTRFLMAKVSFGVPDEAAVETMKARDAEVRDLILGVLGSRTAEELVAAQREGAMRDSLKEAVRKPIAKMFPRGTVLHVSLPRLVVQ